MTSVYIRIHSDTDIWSSDLNQTNMLSLTAQWIDENLEMTRAMLHAQEYPSSHTGKRESCV